MNILITGIHGFVDSNLVVALKERRHLYGLDVVAPEKERVVKNYLWDKEELAAMGKKARELAERKYSKEKILDKFLNAV